MEATHKSATAAYAPKCTPGTREQIIQDIIDWALKNDLSEPILWVPGAAGGGKTCILREVAERCEKGGVLAASYFFSTRVANLDNAKPFVFTIAQQLTERIPALRPYVAQAIRNSPSIFQQSLVEQIQCLILFPLQAVAQLVDITQHRVLPIDGFDECRGEGERKQLLDAIHVLATNSILSFRVIVASRPEYDIRTAFGRAPFLTLTHVIRLERYCADGDIRSFLCDEFAKIRESHPAASSIPPNWPSENDLGTVVFKSSSQFIFAATVIRFVQYRKQSPVSSLRRVLESSESNSSKDSRDPFTELDQLYRLILDPPEGDTDIPLLRRLLHIIMDSEKHHYRVEGLYLIIPDRLDQFLELEDGTTISVLCDTHSLLRVPSASGSQRPPSQISFHHKSLEDFLRSPSRGRNLHQSLATTMGDLLERSFYHVTQIPQLIPPSCNWRPESADYALRAWWSFVRGDLPTISSQSSILEFDPAILFCGYVMRGEGKYCLTSGKNGSKARALTALQTQVHLYGVGVISCRFNLQYQDNTNTLVLAVDKLHLS